MFAANIMLVKNPPTAIGPTRFFYCLIQLVILHIHWDRLSFVADFFPPPIIRSIVLNIRFWNNSGEHNGERTGDRKRKLMVVKQTSISWMRWLVAGLMVTDYTFACLSVQNDSLFVPIWNSPRNTLIQTFFGFKV